MSYPKQAEELEDLDQLAYEPTTPVLHADCKRSDHCPYEILLDDDEFGSVEDESGFEFDLIGFSEDDDE
jgi:hypothetical protein